MNTPETQASFAQKYVANFERIFGKITCPIERRDVEKSGAFMFDQIKSIAAELKENP